MTTATITKSIAHLLREYGEAVESRVRWERLGTWGDPNLDNAKRAERLAQLAVLNAVNNRAPLIHDRKGA